MAAVGSRTTPSSQEIGGGTVLCPTTIPRMTAHGGGTTATRRANHPRRPSPTTPPIGVHLALLLGPPLRLRKNPRAGSDAAALPHARLLLQDLLIPRKSGSAVPSFVRARRPSPASGLAVASAACAAATCRHPPPSLKRAIGGDRAQYQHHVCRVFHFRPLQAGC